MNAITPIETRYRGYRFRSRLEARWAVFFDALKIKWEYEPQGFDLGKGGLYLPDFYLPTFSGGMYVEVKPDGGDFSKARAFAEASGEQIWLAEGVPGPRVYEFICTWRGVTESWEGVPNAADAWGEDRMFTFPGYMQRDGWIVPEDLDCLGDHYLPAVNAARGARFEHGEDGTHREVA